MAQHSITIAFDHVNFYIIYEINVVHTIRKTDHQKFVKISIFCALKNTKWRDVAVEILYLRCSLKLNKF